MIRDNEGLLGEIALSGDSGHAEHTDGSNHQAEKDARQKGSDMAVLANSYLRRVAVVLSALLIVLLGLLSSVGPVGAASVDGNKPSPSSRFTLTSESGDISEISSPQDYRSAGVQFVDNSMTPLQLTNTRYYVIKGRADSTGEYRYPFKVQADRGIQVGGIELAVNPVEHTQLMAIGIPTAASSAAFDQRFGSGSGIDSQSLQSSQSSGVTPYLTTSTAPLHLIWKDPANIWVAEVMTDLRWSWDGSGVSNCAWQDHWEHWYGPTGWGKNSGPSYSGPDYYFSGYSYIWCKVNTTVSFINWAFCNPILPTYINVYQNIAYGNKDGTRSALVDTTTSGDCSNFLSSYWKWG